ncbi:MAG TPA: YwiC-like family protein [Vicinamibacterales bacterium]|jgi:hypothetical protein|nr:YwiC-like family protein [Vicinamibacterales bacterium]
MLLVPKEHGAYGQLALPLLTSFAVAGVTTAAVLTAVAVVGGFLAHEPLLVMLGRRGGRVKRENGARAALWLAVTVTMTAVAGLAALSMMPQPVRRSLMLPLVPAVVLAATISGNREKTAAAEIAVALVFSFVAVPICLAAGGAVRIALGVATVFAVIFVAGTLAVRSLVLGARGGGNPQAARATRVAVVLLTTTAGASLTTAAANAVLPWTTVLAAAPGVVVASWLAVFPPTATRLRTVGWALVASASAAAVILIGGLSGS